MIEPSDGRIDALVDLITRLAGGDLDARLEPSPHEDELDAVAVGINMLAEDLAANRSELEARVEMRTAELEALNQDVMRLTELGNVLQACTSRPEAYAALDQSMNNLFARLSGAMYQFNASRNLLERTVVWGEERPGTAVLTREDCWALRRGQSHTVLALAPQLSCAHVGSRTGDSVCIPMSAHGETLGVLHLMGSPSAMTRSKSQLGSAVAEQTALALSNLELRDTLRVQALRDPLTGLFNRRFADDWIVQEAARADRAGTGLGVIMADLDHFKLVNDVHGHDAGDAVLVAVAGAIRESMRTGEIACRYGGEEFLLLVSDVDLDGLRVAAVRLRSTVARVSPQHRGVPLPTVTVSVGIAMYPDGGASPAAVIHAADGALYEAKRSGRDQVRVALDA